MPAYPPADNRITLPGHPIIAGNLTDDDGQVINSLVEDMAEPPAAKLLPVATTVPPVPVKPVMRLLTLTWNVLPGWPPSLLLPADPDRTALRIDVNSATATDVIRIADDAGKVQSVGGSALIYSGKDIPFNSAYTGPVWVYAPDAVGPVTVSVTAVTT
jgi:hypothetical protein